MEGFKINVRGGRNFAEVSTHAHLWNVLFLRMTQYLVTHSLQPPTHTLSISISISLSLSLSLSFSDTRDRDVTLGDYLAIRDYSPAFLRNYLLPMTAAVWSCSEEDMLDFPARSLVAFWRNHHLLDPLAVRPQWRVVSKRGREYVKAAIADIGGVLVTGCKVERVERATTTTTTATATATTTTTTTQFSDHGGPGVIGGGGVKVFGRTDQHQHESGKPDTDSSLLLGTFDAVILATHADDSLRLLESGSADDLSSEYRSVLGDIEYSESTAILHSDVAMMPRAKRAWSSWNYVRWEGEEVAKDRGSASVTVGFSVV